MLKVLIVDDEIKSRKTLASLITEFCKDLEISDSVGSIDEAISSISKHKPDLVFLDVEMNSETGFDLLEKTPQIKFGVIFTTAYEQYALKAIKYNALDYLLKPINSDELVESVRKVTKAKEKNELIFAEELIKKLKEAVYDNRQLSIPTSNGLIFIKTTDIVWLEAKRSYTLFHLKNKQEILSSNNIKEYEEALDNNVFFRIHKSAIINLGEIMRYIKGAGGYVIMSDEKSVNVSRQTKDEFLNKIRLSKKF